MELTFDIRGYLFPPERIALTFENFEQTFVKSFDNNSSRHSLFERYPNYKTDFVNQVSPNFKQWINGSFVTNKMNPGDIDFVTLLDFELAEKYDAMIHEKFENRGAIQNYGIDAYLVKIYPEDHRFFNRTRSDLLYWEHWFSKTKPNRAKKRFEKGFIELVFSE